MDERAAELHAIVGDAGFVDPDDSARFVDDWTGQYSGGRPLAVVRPASTAEVAEVVRWCHAHDVAVVPQGGNTGLCGGSVPLAPNHPEARPSVVLSLARMTSIVTIDPARATMQVEGGVTVEAVQQAAADAGLLFAPDWGARGTAHIGGGIATNAGGLNVLRWGSMREQILGLEVVLPDGRVWNGLRALRKDSTGLDLKHLFIGTEGTLGIVTAAVLRLHPLPTSHVSAFAALPSLEGVLPLYEHARSASAGTLSAFELVPEDGLWRVLENVPSCQRPLGQTAEWYALLRLSGDETVESIATDMLATAADRSLLTDAAIASTAAQTENLWKIRDELPPMFLFDERGYRHKFDIALPLDRVVDFVREAERVLDEGMPGVKPFVFGHIGDGNLHFNFYPGPECDLGDFDARSHELRDLVDSLTWSHGGTISAEHGVGQSMRSRLLKQKSTVELDLVRTVKAALDPRNVLNPGKVIPPAMGD